MGEKSCQPSGLRPKSRHAVAWKRGPDCGDLTAEACAGPCIIGVLVPFRGRIQSRRDRNLLRPARDTSSAALTVLSIRSATSSSSSTILARNARVSHYVRHS